MNQKDPFNYSNGDLVGFNAVYLGVSEIIQRATKVTAETRPSQAAASCLVKTGCCGLTTLEGNCLRELH